MNVIFTNTKIKFLSKKVITYMTPEASYDEKIITGNSQYGMASIKDASGSLAGNIAVEYKLVAGKTYKIKGFAFYLSESSNRGSKPTALFTTAKLTGESQKVLIGYIATEDSTHGMSYFTEEVEYTATQDCYAYINVRKSFNPTKNVDYYCYEV